MERILRREAVYIAKKENMGRVYTSGLARWGRDVRTRDNRRCQCCGEDGVEEASRLDAHHIHGYRDFTALRSVVENGVTLCRKCHREFHRMYGNIVSEEQFREFQANKQRPCKCSGQYETRRIMAVCPLGDRNITVRGLPVLACSKCGGELRVYGALLSSALRQAFEVGSPVAWMYVPDSAVA